MSDDYGELVDELLARLAQSEAQNLARCLIQGCCYLSNTEPKACHFCGEQWREPNPVYGYSFVGGPRTGVRSATDA